MSISTIDKLKEFARKSGREIEFKEKSYPPAPPNNVTYHRRMLYIQDGNRFFVCFADSTGMGADALFSGVFIPYQLPRDFQMLARKKDIMDKLNPFGKKKTCKTGIPSIDSKIRIESGYPAEVKRMLQDRGMQNKIIDGLSLTDAMQAGVNHMNVDFVPELKGKSHFGIYTQMTWIEDTKIIENLFGILTV